nr:RNA-directed DNA polymerase, eukaryota [Tanacetum cinerariifolium]
MLESLVTKAPRNFHGSNGQILSLLLIKVVIKAFHGNEAGIDLGGCQTSGTWAKIIGTINHPHSSGIVSLNSIRFKVGDSSSIRFWKDTWLGNYPLYIRYNKLFHLENDKDCFISQRILNGSWEWDWCRPITMGRSKTEFDNLIIDISNMEINDLVESDTCVWSLSNDDSFLVNSCLRHSGGHPLKKSQAGKRFSFVCFIKVFSLDRLVKNLRTIWIGSHHLYANQVRFERPHKPTFPFLNGKTKDSNNGHSSPGHRMVNGSAGSYENAINGVPSSATPGSLISSSPALTILHDEGFTDVKPKYMGGLWVMLEFEKEETKANLLTHTGVNSWFHVIQDVPQDFKKWSKMLNIEDTYMASFGRKRLCILTKYLVSILESLKIIVKGKVFMIRANELFTWSPSFLVSKETLCTSDDETVQGVAKTIFDDNSVSAKCYSGDLGKQKSEDPFEIYDLLKERKSSGEPQIDVEVLNLPQVVRMEVPSGSLRQSVKSKGGSILGFLEEVIRVGQAIGYSMEGCEKGIESIIGNQGDKMEILVASFCIWEASIIKKEYVTISDNFVAIYGTWLPSNVKILFVSIYAPQQPAYKRDLWEYMSTLIGRCNGEVILMGDFNEVHFRDERRGSVFNQSGARVFNHFISTSGLVDSFSHSDRNGMIRFKKKLQDLKSIIRQWLKDKRILLSSSKQAIKDELRDIDKELDLGVVTDTSLARRLELKGQLHDIKEKEAADFIQKSKVKWAIEGDENLRFFHGIINKKRSQLAIRGVFVDGSWQNDPRAVKEAFHNHFETRIVSRDEIRMAVWNCGNNKSPGPDGHTFEFFKKYRGFIGPDFCEVVEHFFVHGAFSKGCNFCFIALIPKVIDAKLVNDFRPISLIGCVYKVMTKIMASRLVLVISNIVSNTQSAFVSERQILDGPFIINGILHWCKRKYKKAMFFKVDFAKAYDSVRWDIYLTFLRLLGLA